MTLLQPPTASRRVTGDTGGPALDSRLGFRGGAVGDWRSVVDLQERRER